MTEEEIHLETRLVSLEKILTEHLQLYRETKKALERIRAKDHPLTAKYGLCMQQLRIWTEERIEIVQSGWPSYVDTGELLERVNALPGPKIQLSTMISLATRVLKVRRPENYTAIHRTRHNKIRADLDVILTWGAVNFIKQGKTTEESVENINAQRALQGLPQFKVVAAARTETRERECNALT